MLPAGGADAKATPCQSPGMTSSRPERNPPLELEAVRALAHAEDAVGGMARVTVLMRKAYRAGRVEWWADGGGGVQELLVAAGGGSGIRREYSLDGNGLVVIVGGKHRSSIRAVLAAIAPVLRLRRVEEQLAHAAERLARRNAALEDFAALVAHELKTPLHAPGSLTTRPCRSSRRSTSSTPCSSKRAPIPRPVLSPPRPSAFARY